jgi:hypothetical protein
MESPAREEDLVRGLRLAIMVLTNLKGMDPGDHLVKEVVQEDLLHLAFLVKEDKQIILLLKVININTQLNDILIQNMTDASLLWVLRQYNGI